MKGRDPQAAPQHTPYDYAGGGASSTRLSTAIQSFLITMGPTPTSGLPGPDLPSLIE